jgi:hypothetical protein
MNIQVRRQEVRIVAIRGLTGLGIRTLGDFIRGTCAAAAYCATFYESYELNIECQQSAHSDLP